MKDRKARLGSAKGAGSATERGTGSIDEFFRSVYDSLSVKVLAEAVASTPPTDEELDAIEASIDGMLPAPARMHAKKRKAFVR